MTTPSTLDTAAPGRLHLAGSEGFVSPFQRIEDLPGPPSLPIVGNLLQLDAGRAHAGLETWAARYGPIYRMQLGPFQALGISEPGLIAALLKQRPVALSRSPRLSELIDELGFRGLFTAEGETWRRQRKLVMRALTPEAIKHFFPIIASVTARLEARWRAAALEGRPVNLVRDLKRYSIDVTTWLAMGVDVDTLNHDENPLQGDVETWFATVGRRLPKYFSYWRYLRLPVDRRSDRAVARLHATVTALVAEARARIAAQPALRTNPGNILEALVVARDEAGSEFTDEDVRGNVATMLFAGEDTTANAMAWLLFHLAGNPAATSAATAECDAVLAGQPVVISARDLDGLRYLEAAAVESMRLKPIAPIQGLMTQVDVDLAGLHVPPGRVIFLLPRVAATDAAQFLEPLHFRPERWLDDDASALNDPKRKTFAFGGGPRFCPGRYLAMVEIKMVTSMMLRNFRLSLELAPEAIGEQFTFTMGPDSLDARFALR